MYSRYISFEDEYPPRECDIPESGDSREDKGPPRFEAREPSGASALKNIFGSLKLPELNSDTILLLVLVYFLASDSDDNVSDTVLIIAALLLLGL